MSEETIGVAGSFDAEAFNQGLNKYIAGLEAATAATAAAVDRFNALGASTQSLINAGPVLQTVSRSMAALSRSLVALNTTTINTQLAPFLNELAAAGSKISTVAPGMAQAGKALASFARSLTSLSGVSLSAAPITTFTDQLFQALSKFGRFKTVTTTVENLRSVVRSLQQFSNLQLNAGNIVQFTQQFAPAMLTLSRALRNMSQITQIPAATLNTLKSLGTIFANFGQTPPNVGPFISSVSRLASLLPKLGAIKQVPQGAIDSIAALGKGLSGLSGLSSLNASISALRRLIPIFAQLAQLKPIPQSVLDSIRKLGESIANLGNTQNLNQLSTVLKNLSKATQQLTSIQAAAVPTMQRFSNAFTQGIGVGVGFGVVQTLQGIGNAIADLGREALNSIQFFETFTVSLQSAIAVETRFADSTISMDQAMGQAIQPARALQRGLEKIAVLSPFTTEQIAQAFRTATAYGFTAEQAYNLTNILVDFTSGAGLVGDELYRIALALSQVQARGKLAGDEVKQFANAGIPVVKILAKELGKTEGQILGMITDGEILSSIAIPAIVKHMKQWEGSGKRLAGTFTGLLSSLTDIKQITFRDFFGGAFKPLQPVLQELVDFLSSDQFRAVILNAGEIIGEVFGQGIAIAREAIGSFIAALQSLSPETRQTIITFALMAAGFIAIVTVIGTVSAAIVALVNPFSLLVVAVASLATLWVQNFSKIAQVTSNFVGGVTRLFSGLAQNAVGWGRNIVSSLASGMAQAVGIVVRVLGRIAQVIGRLLKPGSPPKILPDLDIWGRGAAEAYLEGWTTADFGALNDFSSIVQTNLQNLATLGKVDETIVPTLVFDFRNLFAEALVEVQKFGAATQETLAQISKVASLAIDTVSGYVSRYAAVRTATEAVTAAQKELNAAVKAYDEQLKPINDRLAEINRQQQQTENNKKIAQLQRAFNNKGISSKKRASLGLELEEAKLTEQAQQLEFEKKSAQEIGQAKLDAAQATLTAAQQELDLFKAQLEAQQQQVNLLAEQQRIFDQIAKSLDDAAKKMKEGLTELELQMKAIQEQQEALQDNIRAEEARFILADDTSTAAEKYAAQLTLQEVALKRQITLAENEKIGLKVDFTEIDKIPIVIEDFKKKLKGEDALTGDDIIPGLSGGMDELDASLNEFDATVVAVKGQVQGFFTQFQESLDKINESLPSFLQWKQTGEEAATGIDTFTKAIKGLALIFASSRIVAILGGLPTLLRGVFSSTNLITLGITAVALAWENNWFDIQGKTETAVKAIQKFLTDLQNSPQWATITTNVKDIGTLISDLFTGKVIPENAVSLIAQKVKEINAALLEIGKGLIVQNTDQTIEGIKAPDASSQLGFFGSIGKAFTDAFGGLILSIKQFWDEHLNDAGLVSWIGSIIGNFIKLIGEKIGALLLYMTGTALPNIIGAFQWLITTGLPTVKTTLDTWGVGIDNLFKQTFVNIGTGAQKSFTEAGTFFTVTLPQAMTTAGGSIAKGLLDGFIAFFEKTTPEEISKPTVKVLEAIKTFWGIESPSTLAFNQLGYPIGQGLLDGLKQSLIDLSVNVKTELTIFLAALSDMFLLFKTSLTGEDGIFPLLNSEVFKSWEDLGEGSKKRLDQVIKDILDKFTGVGGLLEELKNKFVDEGYNLGKDFGQGIYDGIHDQIDDIEDAARDAAEAAKEAGKKQIQAQSPSKATEREIGVPFGQGFTKGILSQVSSVIAATQIMTDRAMKTMHQRLSTSQTAGRSVSPITNTSTRVFNLNVASSQPSRGIVRDFGIMQVMARS